MYIIVQCMRPHGKKLPCVQSKQQKLAYYFCVLSLKWARKLGKHGKIRINLEAKEKALITLLCKS
jgi:hypothetical protein